MLSRCRNLFHLMELDSTPIPQCKIKGLIRSWEFGLNRGWRRTSKASGDIPHISGFGFRTDLTQLANKVRQFLDSRALQFTRNWKEIVCDIPEIQFLIPDDFTNLGKILDEAHKIGLVPEPPEEPQIIGFLEAL
jgi:hypothetical protein